MYLGSWFQWCQPIIEHMVEHSGSAQTTRKQRIRGDGLGRDSLKDMLLVTYFLNLSPTSTSYFRRLKSAYNDSIDMAKALRIQSLLKSLLADREAPNT